MGELKQPSDSGYPDIIEEARQRLRARKEEQRALITDGKEVEGGTIEAQVVEVPSTAPENIDYKDMDAVLRASRRAAQEYLDMLRPGLAQYLLSQFRDLPDQDIRWEELKISLHKSDSFVRFFGAITVCGSALSVINAKDFAGVKIFRQALRKCLVKYAASQAAKGEIPKIDLGNLNDRVIDKHLRSFGVDIVNGEAGRGVTLFDLYLQVNHCFMADGDLRNFLNENWSSALITEIESGNPSHENSYAKNSTAFQRFLTDYRNAFNTREFETKVEVAKKPEESTKSMLLEVARKLTRMKKQIKVLIASQEIRDQIAEATGEKRVDQKWLKFLQEVSEQLKIQAEVQQIVEDWKTLDPNHVPSFGEKTKQAWRNIAKKMGSKADQKARLEESKKRLAELEGEGLGSVKALMHYLRIAYKFRTAAATIRKEYPVHYHEGAELFEEAADIIEERLEPVVYSMDAKMLVDGLGLDQISDDEIAEMASLPTLPEIQRGILSTFTQVRVALNTAEKMRQLGAGDNA